MYNPRLMSTEEEHHKITQINRMLKDIIIKREEDGKYRAIKNTNKQDVLATLYRIKELLYYKMI